MFLSRFCHFLSSTVSKEQQKELKLAFKSVADAGGHVHKDLWVEGAVSRGIIKEFAELIFNAFDRNSDSYIVNQYLPLSHRLDIWISKDTLECSL